MLSLRAAGVIILLYRGSVSMAGIDTTKAGDMFSDYFPGIIFSRYIQTNKNDFYMGPLMNALSKYVRHKDNEYYLDILQISNDKMFKPLFPKPETVQKYSQEIKNIDEIFDVFKFFITKEDKLFAEKLNAYTEKESQIISGRTLTELFHKEIKNKCSFFYSAEAGEAEEIDDEFTWDFSAVYFSHSVKSIYDAFFYYARKNCTLYLLGADFIRFFKCPGDWPVIPGEDEQSLPAYFSRDGEISNGLAEKYRSLTAADFIRKQGLKWSEDYSKQYLLELFGLDKKLNVSLKNIYHSFCIPLLKGQNYPELLTGNPFIQCGNDIISHTLKRNIHLAQGQISKHVQAWLEIINSILESTPIGTDRYSPAMFETLIQQIAGQAGFLENEVRKQAAKEGSLLDHNDRQNIYNYLREIVTKNLIPQGEDESFFKIYSDGTAYDKIKEIYRLMSFENARRVFQNRYRNIEALYIKAFPLSIDKYREDNDGEIISVVRIEDRSRPKPEDFLNTDELKEIVVEFFNEEFEEREWLNFIKEESAGVLFDDLGSYQPRSAGKLSKATESNFFRNYCSVLNIPIKDARERNSVHTLFAFKMRNISDKLMIMLKDKGYWQE